MCQCLQTQELRASETEQQREAGTALPSSRAQWDPGVRLEAMLVVRTLAALCHWEFPATRPKFGWNLLVAVVSGLFFSYLFLCD